MINQSDDPTHPTLNSNHTTADICPHLGLLVDPHTSMAYPSSQNMCYNAAPPASPNPAHQREFCLATNHIDCDVYQRMQQRPLPANITATVRRPIFRRWITRFIIGLLLALSLAAAAYWYLNHGELPAFLARPTVIPIFTTTATATSTLLISPTAEPSSTLLPPTSTSTAQPITTTPTAHARHMLETPIGVPKEFIVHQVADGESLEFLADVYNTSPESIQTINHNLTAPLWINSVIIIPAGHTDVSDIPPMSAMRIDQDNLTIEAFATSNSLDAMQLCTLNGLPAGYRFALDEWVLIPHPAQ